MHNKKPGSEFSGQYVLTLKENLTKLCKLADVHGNYARLKTVILKDKILHAVNKQLAEYLKNESVSLDDVI